MKKIVVLDGYAMNPGDLSFDGIEALGDCTVYDFTKPGEVLERAKDAEILLSNKTRLTAETIAALPKLEYIGILGHRLQQCRPGGRPQPRNRRGERSRLQYRFGGATRLCTYSEHHDAGAAPFRTGTCRTLGAQPGLLFLGQYASRTRGQDDRVVGFGHTGAATAAIALGFGMKVAAYTSQTSVAASRRGCVPYRSTSCSGRAIS